MLPRASPTAGKIHPTLQKRVPFQGQVLYEAPTVIPTRALGFPQPIEID